MLLFNVVFFWCVNADVLGVSTVQVVQRNWLQLSVSVTKWRNITTHWYVNIVDGGGNGDLCWGFVRLYVCLFVFFTAQSNFKLLSIGFYVVAQDVTDSPLTLASQLIFAR